MQPEQLQANWNYPTDIRAGAGRIAELPASARSLGIRAPLLVTDPGLAALPMLDDVLAMCQAQGLHCEVFSAIKGNPTGANVAAGVARFREGQFDGVIAFGGGSALDAGKAVALAAGQKRPLFDFVDEGSNWKRVDESALVPVIAVPTTAGTGSEVGRASVITDENEQLKKIIFHPGMMPERVILDPELTLGLPAHITAATGMDALTHNLEALCSPLYHPLAEGIALEGIRLVQAFLPRAYANGSDLEARMQMLVASCMGATSFQRGLGGTHALAHPLGALYDAHHGLLNAILLPYVLEANAASIEPVLTRCARYLGLPEASGSGFRQWVLGLREQVGIPDTLLDIGIDDERADEVGRMAAADPTAATNPIPLAAQDYSDIFKRAVKGELVGA